MAKVILNLAVCLHLATQALSAWDPKWNEYHHYQTEPTFRAGRVSVIDVTTDNSLLESGYLFYSPFPTHIPGENLPFSGPQIIDTDGQLIWYGNGSALSRVQNFHVCDYDGEQSSHLCWSEAYFMKMNAIKGENRIFDDKYASIGRAYGAVGGLSYPNPHEFKMLPDGKSFLQTVYELTNLDLTPYNGPQDGYALDGCFQEVDVATGTEIFGWCALDHLHIWQTYIFLDIPANVVNHTGEPYGKGTTNSPWDYFHINSIDKNEEGDYFITGRHLNTIIKVAGRDNPHGVKPGSILWHLGGKSNVFQGEYRMLDISRPHHAHHLKTTATETTMAMFNNQWQVHENDRRISNAVLFTINNETNTVTSVQKYYNPEGLLSFAQGSVQVLENGNIFVGWGTIAQATEFSPNGTVLYHVHLGKHTVEESQDMQNYRTRKYDWVGKPTWGPKLLAYTKSCNALDGASMIGYVSWNGATEVRYWRFHTSQTTYGPWVNAGTFPRDGFETKVALEDGVGLPATFSKYVTVEALDKHHKVLGTVTSETFVPADAPAHECDSDGCMSPEWFDYDPIHSCAGSCSALSRGSTPLLIYAIVIIVLLGLAESTTHIFRNILRGRLVRRQPELTTFEIKRW